RLDDVDRAPVGNVRHRKPRHVAERALVVERRRQEAARLGEEPERALRIHHGVLPFLGASHQPSPFATRSSSNHAQLSTSCDTPQRLATSLTIMNPYPPSPQGAGIVASRALP